jgi:hypothetical protein
MRTRFVALLLALSAVTLAQAASAATIITGTVKSKVGQPLAGIVLLERGELHGNIWDRGALVDQNGRFTITLTEGGRYGLHVYSSGYIYSPQAIQVETEKTLEVNVSLVPEPTRTNDPVVNQVGFFPWEARQGKVTFVKMEVSDPNHDLGPQVMAFNAATGRSHAMTPPRWVWSLKANFPDGVYQLQVDTSAGPINPRDWHFVVADHQCNTSDILSSPHTPQPPKVVR